MSKNFYHIYGDESVTKDIALYGVMLFPRANEAQILSTIQNTKFQFGVSPNAEVHLREMFHPKAKAKTPWKNLDDQNIKLFLVTLVKRIMPFCERPRIGYILKNNAPKIWPNDGFFKKLGDMPIEDKHLAGFAFQGAVGPLVERVGLDHIKMWVDHDKTKIQSINSRVRADSGYRTEFADGLAGDAINTKIIPEKYGPDGKKPPLLELADLLAYSCARALSPNNKSDKDFFIQFYRLLNPEKSNMDLFGLQ